MYHIGDIRIILIYKYVYLGNICPLKPLCCCFAEIVTLILIYQPKLLLCSSRRAVFRYVIVLEINQFMT